MGLINMHSWDYSTKTLLYFLFTATILQKIQNGSPLHCQKGSCNSNVHELPMWNNATTMRILLIIFTNTTY